jgi:two-component system cell cycle response regulator
MNILIAEDDAVSRLILQRAVEKCGHTCVVAHDGEMAWQMFQNVRVDAVVSDWMMPGMDGIELCRHVRAHAEASSCYTYFMFLTARTEKAHLLSAMEAGGDDYLVKPLDLLDLQLRLKVAGRVTSLSRQVSTQNLELAQLNDLLFEQSRQDPVTMLGNRLRLQEDLDAWQGRVERYGHSYCIMLFDIDYFKKYNDRYGHAAGDVALRTVAQLAASNCRRGDTAYRYGGEEFLIILPEQSLASARIPADHLRLLIESQDIRHEGRAAPHLLTISAGVAHMQPGQAKSIDTLLKEPTQLCPKSDSRLNVIQIRKEGRSACIPKRSVHQSAAVRRNISPRTDTRRALIAGC